MKGPKTTAEQIQEATRKRVSGISLLRQRAKDAAGGLTPFGRALLEVGKQHNVSPHTFAELLDMKVRSVAYHYR